MVIHSTKWLVSCISSLVKKVPWRWYVAVQRIKTFATCISLSFYTWNFQFIIPPPPPPHPTQPTCKPPCIYKSRAYNWMFIVFVHCCADTRPNTQRMYFLLVKILLHIQWFVSSVSMYCIPFFSHWCCIWNHGYRVM